MKIVISWYVTLCKLVGMYQRAAFMFNGHDCLTNIHIQAERDNCNSENSVLGGDGELMYNRIPIFGGQFNFLVFYSRNVQ
jgi:hypothetical protein